MKQIQMGFHKPMGVVAMTPPTFPCCQWSCCCCCGGEVRAPHLSHSEGHCFLSAERITVLWSSSLKMPLWTMRQTQVGLRLIRWISHSFGESAHTLTCSALDGSHHQDYSEVDDWKAPMKTHLWKLTKKRVYLLFFYHLIKLPPCSHGTQSQCFSRRSHFVISTSWPKSHNSAVLLLFYF